jgi:hypothetical protein
LQHDQPWLPAFIVFHTQQTLVDQRLQSGAGSASEVARGPDVGPAHIDSAAWTLKPRKGASRRKNACSSGGNST